MKRFSTICICLLLLFALANQTCIAEIPDAELDNLTVDELLALKGRIEAALVEKGYCVFTDISHGDKGDHVVKLQEALRDFGYYSGKISGKYDTATEKAVKMFQKNHGLEVNGTATQAFQRFLYSSNQDGLTSPSASPSPTPKPTEDPVLAEYQQIGYDDYARYPEQYKGKKVILKGKVVQVMGTKEKGMDIRLEVGSGDIVYITIAKGTVDYNILEGDRLSVYGFLDGMSSYISTFLSTITIPSVRADIVTLR